MATAGTTDDLDDANLPKLSLLKERTPQECYFCKLVYPTVVQLKKHLDTRHAFEKNFQCLICNAFVQYGKKKFGASHEKTHFYRGVMVCSACGLQFTTAALFNYHLSTHVSSDIQQPDCTICGTLFSSAEELKAHVKGHETMFR